MKPCFFCIRISAGPLDSSSDPALRIPARSKCRRIRFRHWEAGLSAECRGTLRLNSTTATTSESSGVRTADQNEEGTACLSLGRRCSKVLNGALSISVRKEDDHGSTLPTSVLGGRQKMLGPRRNPGRRGDTREPGWPRSSKSYNRRDSKSDQYP